MEKLLSYSLLPLKENSLRRIAINLWSQTDILTSLVTYDVEFKVEDNMRKLKLPPLLMEQLKNLLKPIGSEIKKWKKFHETYLKIGNINMICILKHLCWTVLGSLDFRKTAENLIRHDIFDTVILYRLACLNCLEEYIPVLWDKLTEEWKNYFYKGKLPLDFNHHELEFCWPCILKGEEMRLEYMPLYRYGGSRPFNQRVFEYSAYEGNKAATEYFFRKLPSHVRQDSLLRMAVRLLFFSYRENPVSSEQIFPKESMSDTICYLLSQMEPEKRLEILKDKSCLVLSCLLDWPWSYIFLEFVALTSIFYNVFDGYVLRRIAEKIKSGYNLSNLFRKFFLLGDSFSRSYFVDLISEGDASYDDVLPILFEVGDSETIKLIFRNIEREDRKKLVTSSFVFELFFDSILAGQWPLVELCLQEATLSKEDKEELKETYAGFFSFIDIIDANRKKCILKLFLNFFDDIQTKIPRKRKANDV